MLETFSTRSGEWIAQSCEDLSSIASSSRESALSVEGSPPLASSSVDPEAFSVSPPSSCSASHVVCIPACGPVTDCLKGRGGILLLPEHRSDSSCAFCKIALLPTLHCSTACLSQLDSQKGRSQSAADILPCNFGSFMMAEPYIICKHGLQIQSASCASLFVCWLHLRPVHLIYLLTGNLMR